MKVLLTAINAKYIHSNLAVYSLKSYASSYGDQSYGEEVRIAEYTINQNLDDILADIFCRAPSLICFSCYLWNIAYVEQLIVEVKKVLPDVHIWLGGPEVSYNAAAVLGRFEQVDGIMCGEGEETFLELLDYYHGKRSNLGDIRGITFHRREKTGPSPTIVENPLRSVMDLSRVPFVYNDMEMFRHKIIYYESSRGCPFSCSYCLSSIDKCLRFRDLELVKKELKGLIDAKVPQVKFVDRTFNCRHEHAMAIWSYIAKHDKGETNFHFEIAADLLNEEELRLIESMRPGLIQLEIGVQSTNQDTIQEIHRIMDFKKVKQNVDRIHLAGNIQQHLDLIAGLPYEDYASFRKSFNDVYSLHPEQLQLGFLKVLKGSFMHEHAERYGLQYQDRPPFEVLSTKWLPYADMIRLKGVEEMVEVYYNSGQFANTLEELEKIFPDACSIFEKLSEYYKGHKLHLINHSRVMRYEVMFAFIKKYIQIQNQGRNERQNQVRNEERNRGRNEERNRGRNEERNQVRNEEQNRGRNGERNQEWDGERNQGTEVYRNLLTIDLYLRDNVKRRPDFAGAETVQKEEAAAFYDEEEKEHRYLKGYEQYDKRQMRKMTHLEKVGGNLLLFDYRNRNAMTNQAKVICIPS